MTTKSTEVAERPSAVPALVNPAALGDIDAGDIALPKLYKGEYQSGFVQDDIVPKGSLFLATGQDDPEPTVLWKPGDKQGVLFHVLSLRKGKSLTVDGEFQTWAFDDPAAPPDADVTYQYTVVLPEAGDAAELPVKLIMSRTSTPCARRLNTWLKRHEARGPIHELAFRLTTLPREKSVGSQTFKWFVFQEQRVEADEANIATAASLAELVAGSNVERSAGPASEPSI